MGKPASTKERLEEKRGVFKRKGKGREGMGRKREGKKQTTCMLLYMVNGHHLKIQNGFSKSAGMDDDLMPLPPITTVNYSIPNPQPTIIT